MSRNSHALSTKFNILYNGDIALQQGVLELKTQYQDNYWELLPVERMQIKEEQMLPNETKNPNFERAEEKATKAIQKHSMNIQGGEKNPQMDEAHLLLGKARYYDQRFVPALEAFNYVLYKYPKSSKIYEVKIWREKTNMRLENDQLAVNNLRKLLKEIKFKDQIYADANAVLAQAFLNLQEKDSAVVKLKLAKDFTKSNEEKSRYHFILGQLQENLGQPDSAFASYQSVIDMNRKAARQYVMHAHINQAILSQYKKGDTILFLKKWNKLIADRENRPFLDALYHQKAKFYESQENFKEAKANYNLSLKKKSGDQYLMASNYRNLATIYFDDAKYPSAGKYYDSTLIYLKPRTREFNAIRKKRENLVDVIKYEAIAHANDSIISLFKMSSIEKVAYYDKYIEKLKIEDAKKQKELVKLEQIKANSESFGGDDLMPNSPSKNAMTPPSSNAFSGTKGDFYFYNPTTIAFGKKQFTKMWGKRKLVDNWRVSSLLEKDNSKEDEINSQENDLTVKEGTEGKENSGENLAYSADFYISKLPTSQTVIDSLSKERNFAYYQLGVIYKEKFKEYQLAVNKLEALLKSNPEERLILPSMYNLYKIYEILDKNKAIAMKARIIAEFPESRYAQILSNPQDALAEDSNSPRAVYEALFKQYEERNFKEVFTKIDDAIDRFTGDEIVPKFELLKANLIGKLSGLDEFQKALNYVALSYPNVEEGKKAEKIITVNLPKLRALQLGKYESTNWKILYQTTDFEAKDSKVLLAKITKFIKERSLDKLSISLDIYTMNDNFIVIHGMKSEETAKGIASILKEYKEYKIQDKAIVISTENYTVVQIKKNLQDYLDGKLLDNPTKPNWDGTLEKLPVAQKEEPKKEEQVNNSSASKSQQSQKEALKKSESSNNTNTSSKREREEDSNFGMPLNLNVPKEK